MKMSFFFKRKHCLNKYVQVEEKKVKSLSHVRLFAIHGCSPPGFSIHGFSRQEYWSGLPFPFPGDLPDPGIEPGSPALQADSLPSEPPGKLKIPFKTGRRWQKSNRGHDAASDLVTCICSCPRGASGRHCLPATPPADAPGPLEDYAWSCSFLKPRSVSSTCLAHSRFSSA